jgi:hypothetical protein
MQDDSGHTAKNKSLKTEKAIFRLYLAGEKDRISRAIAI